MMALSFLWAESCPPSAKNAFARNECRETTWLLRGNEEVRLKATRNMLEEEAESGRGRGVQVAMEYGRDRAE